MPVNILMPALSPTMEKGNLAKWVKKEGDKVKAGDVIAEIETDKATMEVEAVDDGTIGKIVVAEGTQDVPVNQVIAVLLEEGEDAGAIKARSSRKARATVERQTRRRRRTVAGGARVKCASGAADPSRTSSEAAPRTPPPGPVSDERQRWPRVRVASRTPARERFRHRRFARAGFGTAWPCRGAGRRGSKEGRRAPRTAGGCGRCSGTV